MSKPILSRSLLEWMTDIHFFYLKLFRDSEFCVILCQELITPGKLYVFTIYLFVCLCERVLVSFLLVALSILEDYRNIQLQVNNLETLTQFYFQVET